MKVISFIENTRQPEVVGKILRHCGLWKESGARAPPTALPAAAAELVYDYAFFDRECA